MTDNWSTNTRRVASVFIKVWMMHDYFLCYDSQNCKFTQWIWSLTILRICKKKKIKYILEQKSHLLNIYWIQLLKCDDLLLFFTISDNHVKWHTVKTSLTFSISSKLFQYVVFRKLNRSFNKKIWNLSVLKTTVEQLCTTWTVLWIVALLFVL